MRLYSIEGSCELFLHLHSVVQIKVGRPLLCLHDSHHLAWSQQESPRSMNMGNSAPPPASKISGESTCHRAHGVLVAHLGIGLHFASREASTP